MAYKFIACVGQRDLPRYMVGVLQAAGRYYAEQGHMVLSGNAIGGDQAYALGANMVDPERVWLFLPWPTYEQKAVIPGNKITLATEASPADEELAAEAYHKDWHALPQSKRKLFTRNAMLAYCADLVVAHPNKAKRGWAGTGHAMRCAQLLDKKVWLVNENRWWNIREGMRIEQ